MVCAPAVIKEWTLFSLTKASWWIRGFGSTVIKIGYASLKKMSTYTKQYNGATDFFHDQQIF